MNREEVKGRKKLERSTHKKKEKFHSAGDKINEFMFMSLQFVAVVIVIGRGNVNVRERNGNREHSYEEVKK